MAAFPSLLTQLIIKCIDGVSTPPCEQCGSSALHPKRDLSRIFSGSLCWSIISFRANEINISVGIPKGANWFLAELECGRVVEQEDTQWGEWFWGECVWTFSLSVYQRNFETPTTAVWGSSTLHKIHTSFFSFSIRAAFQNLWAVTWIIQKDAAMATVEIHFLDHRPFMRVRCRSLNKMQFSVISDQCTHMYTHSVLDQSTGGTLAWWPSTGYTLSC